MAAQHAVREGIDEALSPKGHAFALGGEMPVRGVWTPNTLSTPGAAADAAG